MIASLAKAVAQLPEPAFRRVLLRGLAGTIVLYLLLYAGLGFGLPHLHPFAAGWANALVGILGGAGAFVISLLLFPGIAGLVMSFLLDEVSVAVEARHYPDLPPPRRQGWGEVIRVAVRFTLVTVALNLAALPIMLPLLFLGVGAVVYYLLNGYLLGREYFELVAWRRLSPAEADALRRAHLGRLWLLGAALAFLSALPLVNLVAPLIGTAAMVHEVEALRRRAVSV